MCRKGDYAMAIIAKCKHIWLEEKGFKAVTKKSGRNTWFQEEGNTGQYIGRDSRFEKQAFLRLLRLVIRPNFVPAQKPIFILIQPKFKTYYCA